MMFVYFTVLCSIRNQSYYQCKRLIMNTSHEAGPFTHWKAGNLILRQPHKGAHFSGTDAALLTTLPELPPEGTFCDVGAGNGVIGLTLAKRNKTSNVNLFELQPTYVTIAKENIILNALEDRVKIYEMSIFSQEFKTLSQTIKADCVITNPPFYRGDMYRPPRNKLKALSYKLIDSTLSDWLRACALLLKPKGQLVFIHRADHLKMCLEALDKHFGDVQVTPIYANPSKKAIRLVITTKKGSRAPLKLLPPHVIGIKS